MDQPPNWPFGTGELAWIIIAMMGGVARYLDSYLKSGAPPKWGMALGHAIVSGFSGYMVAQVAMKFEPDWALIAAGIGGYLGTQGLDFLADLLKKRMGGAEKGNGDK